MALEDLEKKIYSRESRQESKNEKKSALDLRRRDFEPKPAEQEPVLAENWGEIAPKSEIGKNFLSKFSGVGVWAKRIFWFSAAIMTVLIVVSGFYLYKYFSAGAEITLSVSAPANIMSGAPFDLTVNFENNSENVLNDLRLSIFLPEGAVVLGEDFYKRTFEIDFGNLEAGSGVKEDVPFLIFSEGQTLKKIDVAMSYSSVLKSRFEKRQSVEITAAEPAISLDMSAPEKVLNDESFEISVSYANKSGIGFPDVYLDLILPQNFKLKEADRPFAGGELKIGGLKPKETGTFSFSGSIIGPEQSFFEIGSQVKISYSGQKFLIDKKTASVNIASSPLALKVYLDSESGGFVSPGETLKYRLAYQNNSEIDLSDAIIEARLAGEMFDYSSLKTAGSFDSRVNVLTWNAGNSPDLRFISASGSGSVEFEINAKESYPIRRLSDKNFVLKIKAEISSPTVPYYVTADKTIGLADLETKVVGDVVVEPRIYFRDPDAAITNKGTLPLKVNSSTEFAVHWIVRNYATDVNNVIVRAYLAPGVKFKDVVKSNIPEIPAYNERTQEIVWNIPRISAAKGIVGSPIEAVFRVEATPNVTQIGNEIPLLGETAISAFDEFVGIEIKNVFGGLTSKSLSDGNFDQKMGEVIQ